MNRILPTKPKDGTERVVRRFLLLPKTLNRETRWLEFAKIRQVYHPAPRIFAFWRYTARTWSDGQWEN